MNDIVIDLLYQRFHEGNDTVDNDLRQSREFSKIEITFSALNIQPNLSRSTSARGDFASSSRSDENRKIEEGVALLVRRRKIW